MKNKTLIAIFLAGIIGFAGYFIIPELPIPANLQKVKEKVIPKLKQEFAAKNLAYGSPIFIRIFKEPKELELWVQDSNNTFTLFKTYKICKYSGKLGPKLKQGDKQAPEGFYKVSSAQMNPHSRFHLSFNLGYPNQYDTAYNRTGENLMVHGSCFSTGCYAVGNKNVEEIYLLAESALQNGQDRFNVHIFPFRMTEDNLEKHKNSEWKSFWDNLKTGYNLFEKDKIPPDVKVENQQYIFSSKG